MAIKKKTKKKKSKPAIDMTLWDVILSYPDLHEPKPFKGSTKYSVDVLLDEDHPQLADLRAAVHKVKVQAFGPDKSEWPKAKNPLIQDGNRRADQKGYKDRRFIVPKSDAGFGPVPVLDMKGKAFNPQAVKGGMFANVAIRIAKWEYEGDEGVSIYLSGVQVDTKKKSLNFGGGKSVAKMFDLDEGEEAEDAEERSSKKKGKSSVKNKTGKFGRGNDEDEPRGKKKKRSSEEE